jgi:hypothetical protein
MKNLFIESGQVETLRTIQDAIDANKPLSLDLVDSEMGLFAVAEMLLRFLDSLTQPVIPYGFFARCMDSAYDGEAAIAVQNVTNLYLTF